MAGITIQGIVIISTVKSRERSTVRTDAGTIEAGLSITGITSGVTLVVAREYERMLNELAWYSRHAGGVYINSDDYDIDDGLYVLSDVRCRATPETSQTALFEVSLTLRRLGGSPIGGNIVQRVRAQSTLIANSYSITSTPRIAIPVGATPLDLLEVHARAGQDGTAKLFSSAPIYALSGADYLKGECRVWDTGGDTGTDSALWKRVWSPDHSFADPSHLVIENGLLRITGISGTNKGSHRYWAWTGAAYTEVSESTRGDSVLVSTTVTVAYSRITIDALTPWRVKVTFRAAHSASPYFVTKVITLERGHPLARVELSIPSAQTVEMGFRLAGRWVFTKGAPLSGGDMQRPAFDDTEEAGVAALNAPEDNWVASFTTKSSTVGTLAIGAWASSSLTYYAIDGGGFIVSPPSATSLVVYLGGVKYDTSSAQLEAEAGTLTGGADLVSTVAGASGSGSDQVRLDAVGSNLDIATNLASIGGSTVLMLFRIAIDGVLTVGMELIIRNSTTSTDLASVTRDETHFAATNTWYWQAVVGTGWNGTDTLVARANKSVGANATSFYVDQCIVIAIAGSATLMQVDDMAAQALTETIAVPITARQVY